jgi:HD-GYP domain-containing protein (c-di-GMP phosphodiesterase class II)
MQSRVFDVLKNFNLLQIDNEKLISNEPLQVSYTRWYASYFTLIDRMGMLLSDKLLRNELENIGENKILSRLELAWISATNQINLVNLEIQGLKDGNHPVWKSGFLNNSVSKENVFLYYQMNETRNDIHLMKQFLSTVFKDELDKLYEKTLYSTQEGMSTRTIVTIIIVSATTFFLFFILIFYYGSIIKLINDNNMQREMTRDVTIQALAFQAELKDKNTGQHIERTSEYVRIIAEQLATHYDYAPYMTKRYIADLVSSAPLHDIGKIGIPDKILQKKGKLTVEEFEIMKTHCDLGAKTLKMAQRKLPFQSYLEIAIQMIETHHEKWDGSGYPRGLKGEEIPLSGRIMAIADVYDAMNSARAYKEGYSHQDCLEYILDHSGTQFDPLIVEVFYSVEKKIQSVSLEKKDPLFV